jgi:AcrR family transcriptional regulator
MARLFFEAGGAGRGFQAELNSLHDRFARLIQEYLDAAVADGTIPPLDTRVTSVAWFGALDEVVARWLQAEHPGRLEDAYPTLRAILLRSAGVSEGRIAAGVPIVPQPLFPELPR